MSFLFFFFSETIQCFVISNRRQAVSQRGLLCSLFPVLCLHIYICFHLLLFIIVPKNVIQSSWILLLLFLHGSHILFTSGILLYFFLNLNSCCCTENHFRSRFFQKIFSKAPRRTQHLSLMFDVTKKLLRLWRILCIFFFFMDCFLKNTVLHLFPWPQSDAYTIIVI